MLRQATKQNLWGIVLAGGDGTRVREFLTHLCGERGLKQFCAVVGRRSMLEHTLARVERLIPRERILVVVCQAHRPEASRQLAHWPRENIIWQPANRDTAPGILLPLAHVSHRDPFATVAVFPSDHFILEEERFMMYVQKAVVEAQRFPDTLTLLGMKPDRLEEGYGWIELAEAEPGRERRTVRRFWEKPSPTDAQMLLYEGALWNMFILVAQANTLWEMTLQAAPELHKNFLAIRRALQSDCSIPTIETVYRTMRAVNFSRDICEVLTSRLRVLPVPDVGWSDWGSVERIVAALQQLGKLEECLARLRRRGATVTWPLPLQAKLSQISVNRQ